MAFRFRLQAVLAHRRHLEELARLEFAKKLAAERRLREHLAWLKGEYQRARAELDAREVDGISAREYVVENEYLTVLRLKTLGEEARLPRLTAETEQARQKLLKATIDRKALESLERTHRERWHREELLLEQKALDEAAVGGFLRREEA